MADVTFEWGARKNRANQKKHGVAFEEARTAFFDDTLELSMIRSTQTMRNGLCSSDWVPNCAF